MEEKRKRIILLVIAITTILLVTIGATYAYFQAQADIEGNIETGVTTGTTDHLTFSLADLAVDRDNITDTDSNTPININADMTNFYSGSNSLADGVTGTANLIANDTTYSASEDYNVYLNINKNELQYTSYTKKEPLGNDEDNIHFNSETKKSETDLSSYNPIPELYLTIKKNGVELKSGVTLNDTELTYASDVFTKGEDKVGGFDITEAKGLVKIEVPATIVVEGDEENHSKTDTWEIIVTFVNLGTDQNLNTGKSVQAEVLIQTEEYIPQDIKNVNQLLADANKDGQITLYHHNAEDLTDPNMANKDKIAGDDSYHFSGPDADVKNYVCLDNKTTGDCTSDDDLYRIIGLFKNTDEASEDYGKYEMKLIKAQGATTTELGDNDTAEGGSYYDFYKNGEDEDYDMSRYQSYYKGSNWETLAGYYWNNSQRTNMWQYSNLNTVNLNGYFYDYITTRATYLENHITEHTWTIGGYANVNVDAKAVYDLELGEGKVQVGDNVCYTPGSTSTTRECKKEDLEYPAHIGLFYISDYMYGTIPSNWTTVANSYDDITSYNWLYSGMYEWTISRYSSHDSYVRYVTYRGSANNSDPASYYGFVARPSFYLTSDAKIKEGEGTKGSPYRITFE